MAQAARIDVLVVDDELAVAELILEVLRDEGLSAVMIHDGRQVLVAVQQLAPRLVMLDVMMPGLTGLQVIDALRREAGVVPAIVLMSAAGLPPRAPLDVPFLAKPFNIDDLVSVVRRALAAD